MAHRATVADLDRQCRQNKNDIEALHERLDETNQLIRDTRTEMLGKFAEIDGRFAEIDGRFTEIDGRFTKIDNKFTEHDLRFDRLDGQLAEVLDILRKGAG